MLTLAVCCCYKEVVVKAVCVDKDQRLVVDRQLAPGDDLKQLLQVPGVEGKSATETGTRTSSVPSPPARTMKASDSFCIFSLRSCIDWTMWSCVHRLHNESDAQSPVEGGG